MATEATEIAALTGDVEGWIRTINKFLKECEGSGGVISSSDVTYFTANAYPNLWEHAIAPIWDDIRDKLSVKGTGLFAILRTKGPSGGRTGTGKNQHLLPVRTIGKKEGFIWNGEKWLKFETGKVFRCSGSAYIMGDVEFLVINEKEV